MATIFLIMALSGGLAAQDLPDAPPPAIQWAAVPPSTGTGGPRAELVFGGGAATGELRVSSLRKDYAVPGSSGTADGAAPRASSRFDKLLFKDMNNVEWQMKSNFSSDGSASTAAVQRSWEVAVRFLRAKTSAYYRLAGADGDELSITRLEAGGSESRFYTGAPGLPLFSALAASELKEAAADQGKSAPGDLAPAERDEVLTSAFLQVFGLPGVSEVKAGAEKGAVAAAVRGDGQLAGDFHYLLTIRIPASATDAEAFARSLKDAAPVLNFIYDSDVLGLGGAFLRAGGAVYDADLGAPLQNRRR